MNQDTFNMELRKFLKKVGVTSQHEIEQAVEMAIAKNMIEDNEKLAVNVVLSINRIDLRYEINGSINLE